MILFSPLSPLENILRHALDWLHGTIGLPWAWSIVALTILVRIALVPLTVRQIHSMQAMQRHMPEMKAIQQKYKTDKKQRYLMMVLPIFFITFLLRFPMGLVIYWVTTNLWTVGQGLVTRQLTQKTSAAQLQRRSSRTPPKEEPAGDGAGKAEPASARAAAPSQPRRVKRKKRARR